MRTLTVAALAGVLMAAGCTASSTHSPRSSTPASSTPSTPASTTPASTTPAPPSTPRPTHSSTHRAAPTTTHVAAPHKPASVRLPLNFSTGDATEVITVVAPSESSTQATLQTWHKSRGSWHRVGPAVAAWVGSDGMTTRPSEFRSATPIGSFTLTQAFGRDANPGTALPYTQTTPDDWWISQDSPYYNTRQRCASHCPFTQGAPNEHLYYETPYYDYAVVINTPSGLSAYPHGSAFFLHVTHNPPTAGCVSIPQDQLVRVLRWLTPSAHPRILIGTG